MGSAAQEEKAARRVERMYGNPEQKARMEWMAHEVASGRSVLGSNEARTYMEKAITALREDLITFPTTVQEYLACDFVIQEDKAQVEKMTQSLHSLIYLSEISPIPRDRRNTLNSLTRLLSQHPNHAFVIIGIFSDALPLTSDEEERANRVLELIDEYYNVESTEWWRDICARGEAGDAQDADAITEWATDLEHRVQGDMNVLMDFVTGGNQHRRGNTRYLYTYNETLLGPPKPLSPKERQRRSEEALSKYGVVDLLNMARKSIGAMEKGESPSKGDILALEARLRTQLSPEALAAIASLIPSGENATPGSNAEFGLPSSQVIDALSSHATTMTWKQLSTFASLVSEYNEEWAISAMEW